MSRFFESFILNIFPKQIFTWFIGCFAKRKLSRHMIPTFIRYYDINDSEAECEICEYKNLQQFFCRRLKQGVRPICASGVASPVDGCISEFGEILDGTLLQAKGSDYFLKDLLGDEQRANRFLGGTYMTIYLSPRNYHRIHMPVDGVCTEWVHIPGRLFPVNALGVRSISGLFTKNERVVTYVQSEKSCFCLVKVGAAGVGSVRTHYLPKRYSSKKKVTHGVLNMPCLRGDEVGWFEFGSTVILIFERGFISHFTVQLGDFVHMGEQIAIVQES